MKLKFTNEELAEGVSIRRMGDKTISNVRSEMTTVGAFNCDPARIGDQTVSGVIIHEMLATDAGRMRLTFTAISCPVYEAHNYKSDLMALTLGLDPQVTIDEGGVRKTNHTLNGPGTDASHQRKAQEAFGRLISEKPRHRLVQQMVAYLKELAGKKAMPAEKEIPIIPPTEGFEKFWQAYPNKVGKAVAAKAWEKLKCAEFAQKIMDAVAAAKASDAWTSDNGKFIPHPITWLNQGRWDDEHQPSGRYTPAADATW